MGTFKIFEILIVIIIICATNGKSCTYLFIMIFENKHMFHIGCLKFLNFAIIVIYWLM